MGFRTYWLPFENVERVAGQTKWNFWGLFKYAIDGIILFIVVRRLLFGDPVAGWASTICVIILIGGLQLFCLGIIGQYIAKIYLETKHRPHFIVAESNRKDAALIR